MKHIEDLTIKNKNYIEICVYEDEHNFCLDIKDITGKVLMGRSYAKD